MKQLATVMPMAALLAIAGCSNSNVCCIDYNGSKSYWQCPSAAAETACCGTGSTGLPGCITDPMDPASSACTNNASPSDCP